MKNTPEGVEAAFSSYSNIIANWGSTHYNAASYNTGRAWALDSAERKCSRAR